MKKLILIIAILLFFSQGLIQSQYTNPIEFFPLNVGNLWVYQCSASGYGYCYCVKQIKIKTTNSLTIYGKTYFIFQKTESIISQVCSFCGCGIISFDTLRIDSVNYNIYKYSVQGCAYSPHEVMIDSLKARLNDTIKTNCINENYICVDTSSQNIFGMLLPSRLHSIGDFEFFSGRRYIKGIGLSGFGCSYPMCVDNSSLLGCVINGIVYGDTSFPLGVNQIGNGIPENFSLSQNYPNPFNPLTKIKFDIAKSGKVKLIIFNTLGQEIELLVNTYLKPGTYEVQWDGTGYPSGVYFYKLIIAKFSETKTMALIK